MISVSLLGSSDGQPDGMMSQETAQTPFVFPSTKSATRKSRNDLGSMSHNDQRFHRRKVSIPEKYFKRPVEVEERRLLMLASAAAALTISFPAVDALASRLFFADLSASKEPSALPLRPALRADISCKEQYLGTMPWSPIGVVQPRVRRTTKKSN